jgi:hypothetical protein
MMATQSEKGFVQVADIDSILRMVREWIGLVSKHDFVSASDYLTPVPGAKVVYSPDVIKEAFGRYSRRYREADPSARDAFFPKVSDPTPIDKGGENLVIYGRTGVGIAFVEYDVPIDGRWSDLTASFFVLPVDGGGFGLGLEDVHVL